MKILKSVVLSTHGSLTSFVDKHKIPREDIAFITEGAGGYTLFFYGDPAVEQERGFWD